ncbi:hypothetical protein AB4084_30635, partial [Lysobacter sp. 2RAB21]
MTLGGMAAWRHGGMAALVRIRALPSDPMVAGLFQFSPRTYISSFPRTRESSDFDGTGTKVAGFP